MAGRVHDPGEALPGTPHPGETDSIAGPVERASKDIDRARFNIGPTASVHDSARTERAADDAGARVRFNAFEVGNGVGNGVGEVWSIETSSGRGLADLLISPSGLRCLVPELDFASARRPDAGYFTRCELRSIDGVGGTRTIDLQPYQASLLDTVWSDDSGVLYMKLVHQDEPSCCIGRVSDQHGKITVYPETSLSHDSADEHADALLVSGSRICFVGPAGAGVSKRTFDWFRFDTETRTLDNLTADFDDLAEIMWSCGGGEFLGCAEGDLIRYEFAADPASRTVVSPGGTGSATHRPDYRIVFPRVRSYNSRSFLGDEGPAGSCLVARSKESGFDYFRTRDGHAFETLDVPDDARPLAFCSGPSDYRLVALRTDRSGNEIVRVTRDGERVLGRFNDHLEGRRHAETRFFTAEADGERIHCEMILPANAIEGSTHATVVFIYPGVQFRPHENVHAHDAGLPHFLNPHVYAANGYGVLLAGMPLHPERMVSDGVFAEFSRIVRIGVDEACRRGFAHEDRLFIQGHSRGGYAATGILTRTGRFRGCIASAGAYNPLGEYGVFDPDPAASGEPGSCRLTRLAVAASFHPWEGAEHYVRSSPLLHANEIDTPLLMLHGEQDHCVRVAHAQQMYTALLLRQRPVRLVLYGGEGHVISSRHNVSHSWKARFDFLAEHDALQRRESV